MPKYERKELDFKLNGFGRQKVFTEAEAYARQLVTLLFMRPGDFPSIPKLGINITKEVRYKNMDYVTGGALKEKIMEQIRTYADQIDVVDLSIDSVKYKGQYYVLFNFQLQAEKTITIAMTKNKISSLFDYRVEFN